MMPPVSGSLQPTIFSTLNFAWGVGYMAASLCTE